MAGLMSTDSPPRRERTESEQGVMEIASGLRNMWMLGQELGCLGLTP